MDKKQVFVVMKYDEILISAGDVLGVFDSQEKAEEFIRTDCPFAGFEVHDLE